ncbi:MAG: DUF4352 domain-containing protein [Nitrososphaerales archaeon]
MLHHTILFLLPLFVFPMLLGHSFATTTGLVNEVVTNEQVQIYVIDVREAEFGEKKKRVSVEVIFKNIEPGARVFNPFFTKLIDADGNERQASPLMGTILPIRIASNDILKGRLAFVLPNDATTSSLVWEEFEGTKLTVDLTKIKSPADPVLKSDWVLSSNKGRIFSDDRTQLTINDELLNKSPTFYLVDISIKNLGTAIILYNPTYTFVKDQDGNLYPADIQNFHLMNNPLKRGELKQGEEVRGEILFLLPDTVSKVMFIYDESLGRGSYFVAPEFPFTQVIILTSLITIVLLLQRSLPRFSNMIKSKTSNC